MIEYDVVGGFSVEILVSDVRKWISEGWEPLGGVVVTHYDGDPRKFFQAMIRRQTPDHPPRQVP